MTPTQAPKAHLVVDPNAPSQAKHTAKNTEKTATSAAETLQTLQLKIGDNTIEIQKSQLTPMTTNYGYTLVNHFDDKGNEVSQYCLVNTKTDETTLLDPKYTIKQEGNKTFAHYTNNEGEKIKKQFVDLNDDRFGLVKRVIGSKERYTQIGKYSQVFEIKSGLPKGTMMQNVLVVDVKKDENGNVISKQEKSETGYDLSKGGYVVLGVKGELTVYKPDKFDKDKEGNLIDKSLIILNDEDEDYKKAQETIEASKNNMGKLQEKEFNKMKQFVNFENPIVTKGMDTNRRAVPLGKDMTEHGIISVAPWKGTQESNGNYRVIHRYKKDENGKDVFSEAYIIEEEAFLDTHFIEESKKEKTDADKQKQLMAELDELDVLEKADSLGNRVLDMGKNGLGAVQKQVRNVGGKIKNIGDTIQESGIAAKKAINSMLAPKSLDEKINAFTDNFKNGEASITYKGGEIDYNKRTELMALAKEHGLMGFVKKVKTSKYKIIVGKYKTEGGDLDSQGLKSLLKEGLFLEEPFERSENKLPHQISHDKKEIIDILANSELIGVKFQVCESYKYTLTRPDVGKTIAWKKVSSDKYDIEIIKDESHSYFDMNANEYDPRGEEYKRNNNPFKVGI